MRKNRTLNSTIYRTNVRLKRSLCCGVILFLCWCIHQYSFAAVIMIQSRLCHTPYPRRAGRGYADKYEDSLCLVCITCYLTEPCGRLVLLCSFCSYLVCPCPPCSWGELSICWCCYRLDIATETAYCSYYCVTVLLLWLYLIAVIIQICHDSVWVFRWVFRAMSFCFSKSLPNNNEI